MYKRLRKKTWLKKALAVVILALSIYLLMVFADHPRAVERYYSQGIYPWICKVLHPVFNIFPFSLGDVIYLAVIIFLLYAIVRIFIHLFKKRFESAGMLVINIIIGVEVAVLMFYTLWGLNYFRPSAAERLKLPETAYTIPELQTVTERLIDSANATRLRVTQQDLKQTNDTIYSVAQKAVLSLSAQQVNFRTYSPRIKPSMLTWVLNYITTSGYYNPFTTEAQMNYQMPVFNRPFVACHEMSHQMGYGPEDEANFAGYIAGVASNDRLLKYSSYYLAAEELMHTARFRDTTLYHQLKKRLSPAVTADMKTELRYWMSYKSKLDDLSSIFYDNFLKANNQPEGLDAYNQMVSLLMAYYRKH